jgi:two-component system, NtrC family, sensor kinase
MAGPQVRWRRRVSLRLTALIVVVVATTAGALVALGLRTQQRHVVGEVVRGAALLSDTIKNSTHQHMLEDRRQDAYAMMQAIGGQEGIEKVRIFNKEGRITFSSHREETGAQVDKRAESCYACHAAGQPIVRLSVPSRSRIYRANGHRILGMVTPIYNEASCASAACHAHPESQRVLGVVDVGISLAEIDRGLSGLGRQTAQAAALGLLVLAAGVAFVARRIVTRPVAELMDATRRIAEGDLEHRIALGPAEDDEIGLLARSFNGMTDSLARARAEIRELMQGLETKVEQRTSALRDAQAQLGQSEKLASLGRMAASIAHEINNPLAGILTFAKLIIRTLEDDGEAVDREVLLRHLALVEREAGRCTAIVRNLLEFARQRPLALAPTDVNAAVEEALSLVAHQLSLKGVALAKRLEPLPPVPADFGQLRQAFVNVALNAGDAMAGGGRLTVASRALAGGGVEVCFEDTGVGIPEEHLARIFDPFFSTKEKGTGLGLSVVYGIVQRHGGDLDVRSRVGEGTTMRIRLAAGAAAREETAAAGGR